MERLRERAWTGRLGFGARSDRTHGAWSRQLPNVQQDADADAGAGADWCTRAVEQMGGTQLEMPTASGQQVDEAA